MKNEIELKLEFPTDKQLIVHFKGRHLDVIHFKLPKVEIDGKQLFKSVFSDSKTLQLFRNFQNQEKNKLLIINTHQSAILSLPWECLYDPQTTYLCHDITIRRSLVTQPLIAKVGDSPPNFFGRSRELWQIEKAFIQEDRRSFTITGVEGQGKTYLALEAAQWLSRTGLFNKICYIDYATFFGVDVVGFALRALSKKFEKELENITDVAEILQQIPTLLIFDNMETVPPTLRQELLETAKQLSKNCRILLTSDEPENNEHSLSLSGLLENDAIGYFKHLLKLPPAQQVERENLLKLFKQVNFHPLSMNILAIPLKKQRPLTELAKSLETWLAQLSDNPLWATLITSLEGFTIELEREGLFYWLPKIKISLTIETLHLLPFFGVFQGGAFEPDLLSQPKIDKKQWQALRLALESAGLIKIEHLPNFKVSYIRFHPSLAPILWKCLSPAQQKKLFSNYQFRYAQLAGYMFSEEGDSTTEVHTLVRQDLPNLLHAVYGALDARRMGADKFAKNIDLFLNLFLYKRDSAALNERIKKKGSGSYQA